MRLILTGGAGYIGSHTLIEALREGHDVLVVDNFSNSDRSVLDRVSRFTNRQIEIAECDIRNRDHLIEIFKSFEPDAVIHFAGLKAVGESSQVPATYYGVNVGGSVNVIEAMEACDCKRIVFSSSATVYGQPQYLPIDEKHPLSATNPYGRSKLHVEEILNDQGLARPDWSIAILRYFNPVGAHDNGLIGESPEGTPNNLMPYVAQVASGQRAQLTVFGDDYETPDGTGVRDYIHVVDLALAHLSAITWTTKRCGVRPFNLGVGQGTSVLGMIDAFKQASGREIPYVVSERRPGDVASCFADATRAAHELGWTAKRDISQMCVSGWKWQTHLVKSAN